MSVKEAEETQQKEYNRLVPLVGHHRALARDHQRTADDLEKQIDTVIRKINTLQANAPKEKQDVSKQESNTNGSMGTVESSGTSSEPSDTAPSIASL